MLGGITVLFFLPAAISTAHAGLAEIFFCMTVAIAHLHVAAMDGRLRREAACGSEGALGTRRRR